MSKVVKSYYVEARRDGELYSMTAFSTLEEAKDFCAWIITSDADMTAKIGIVETLTVAKAIAEHTECYLYEKDEAAMRVAANMY